MRKYRFGSSFSQWRDLMTISSLIERSVAGGTMESLRVGVPAWTAGCARGMDEITRLAGSSCSHTDSGTSWFSSSASNSSLGYEPITLEARVREQSGSRVAMSIRKSGRIPGILLSLPEEKTKLLSFDHKDITKQIQNFGRIGWESRVFDLKITGDASDKENTSSGMEEIIRAVGRQVHIEAATGDIENVTLLHCPPERLVRVNVPVKLVGQELCPGLKMGGRINWISRTVRCLSQGNCIPSFFEIDVSEMSIGDKINYNSLSIPEGVKLIVKDPLGPIIKIMRR